MKPYIRAMRDLHRYIILSSWARQELGQSFPVEFGQSCGTDDCFLGVFLLDTLFRPNAKQIPETHQVSWLYLRGGLKDLSHTFPTGDRRVDAHPSEEWQNAFPRALIHIMYGYKLRCLETPN